ncbi:unnamed protein product [Schistosoma mattheei]|uniref:Uncharacterized protein n=1 Tax=Schistosoma mattheei TaxID=31246 RepID=A0AA85ATH8_9TREM|nr:unnamed protein product [Schistosoma mattheei]
MSLREPISVIDLEKIRWFFVTLWFKLLVDATTVSTAACISLQATSGSASFSELSKCDLVCSWNLILVFSLLISVLVGLFNVTFLRPVRRKQMRARIRAWSESKQVLQNERQSSTDPLQR